MRREPPAHLGDDLRLHVLPLFVGQRLTEKMDVRRRARRLARHADGRLDVRDPFDPLEFLEHLERDLGGAFERCPLGCVEVDGPFTHILIGDELAPDHEIERNGQ